MKLEDYRRQEGLGPQGPAHAAQPTRAELLRLFPDASDAFLRLNAAAGVPPAGAGAATKLERHSEGVALEAPRHQEAAQGRVHIRITSVRKGRLIDPDNLFCKATIDLLRYGGAIRDDRHQDITLETGQRKAAKGEAEHTEIEIYEGE